MWVVTGCGVISAVRLLQAQKSATTEEATSTEYRTGYFGTRSMQQEAGASFILQVEV